MKKSFKILCILFISLGVFTNTFHTLAEPPTYTSDDTAVDCQHQEEIHESFLKHLGKTSGDKIIFIPNLREQYTTYHSYNHTCKHKIHSDFLRKNSLTLWDLLFDKVNKKTVDDTDLDLYNQDKLGQKFLDSLENPASDRPKPYDPSPTLIDAYTSYKYPVYCDLINACLRGDLFVHPIGGYDGDIASTSRPFQPPSFDTNLHVSVKVAVEIMGKALELKNYLCNHQLPQHNLTVYRGVCQPKVLHSVANNNINNLSIITESLKKLNTSESTVENFLGKNVIYQAKDISSTSKSLQTAKRYADRHRIIEGPLPIVMQIDIQPGTACGEICDDLDREVMLQPNQQIQINSASREGAYIILHCQTITTEAKK